MAVVVGRLAVDLTANTAAFESRLVAAGQAVNRMTRSTADAGRGLGMARSGIEQLTRQLLPLPPALSQVATGFGSIALGSPIMLGVMAAAGAIALVYKTIKGNIAEAIAEQQKFLQGLAAVGPSAAALVERMKLQQLEADLDRKVFAAMRGLGISRAEAEGLPALQDEQRAIATQQIAVARAERLADAAIATTRAAINRTAVKLAETLLAEARRAWAVGIARLQGVAGPPPSGIGILATTQDTLRLRMPARVQPALAPSRPEPGFRFTPEFGVMASMALMQGIQSRNVGGFLGAAAGPVAMVNPLAGAITAGVGGIFGLFNRDEDKRHRELVDELRKIGKEVGLERVTVVFTGPDGQQIRKSLAELEAGDAVDRIPSPAGATG